MRKSWSVIPARALKDKKSRLAILLVRGLNSQLSQVARPSHQPALFWKNWLFAFQTHISINTLHTHEILKASRENFERETLEKNKIDLSTIFTLWFFKFLNSHPLHCYILERFVTKTFSTIPISMRRLFGGLGSSYEGTNSNWLMLWFIVEFDKLKKK